MTYNFDEIINRKNTDSLKYDMTDKIFGAKDLLPMWVADMDFRTPDFIMDAIRERAGHEVLGYTFKPQNFNSSIINWIKEKHGWDIRSQWLSVSPGVVAALAFCIMTYSKPGDQIIVQPPVYYPFFQIIKEHNRVPVYNQLIKKGNRYYMDFDDLKSKINKQVKMLFLCNPHNPGGTVWTKEELEQLAEICLNNNILVISDEIHADLVFKGKKHIPFASISKDAQKGSITTYAASKTFNLAGLSTSVVIIPDLSVRRLYNQFIGAMHLRYTNIFGMIATATAFSQGNDWLAQLMVYLEDNLSYILGFLAEKLPKVDYIKPDATYLLWLDFSNYGLTGEKLKDFFIQHAKLGFNSGETFGPGGEGFMRMNFGCPRAIIEKALHQLNKALNEYIE